MNATEQDVACPSTCGLRGRTSALAVLMVIGGVACGESDDYTGPPAPGSITVETQTTGFAKDDGYELLVNGTSEGAIGANDEMTVSGLDPDVYDVSLGDVAANCSVESLSLEVVSDQTADGTLAVVCAASDPVSYTIRFSRDRPDLETGELTECSFGFCPTTDDWDLYVHNSSQTTPQSVIRQNQTNGVEIAHLPGVTLDDMTEEDVAGATWTTELVADPFDAGRVILIKTDLGNVYALGNPVEDTTALTLTFDAVLLTPAP